jgi:predicted SAM-dependent methyltransferase
MCATRDERRAVKRRPRRGSALDRALGPLTLRRARARDARRLAALAHTQPRLHLGSGSHPKPGWVNLDLGGRQAAPGDGSTVVLNYDLTRSLPLPDGTCTEVYSSHFLEHLTAREGAAVLSECHRVLRAGDRIRTCLPDFGRLARAYVAGDVSYFAPLHEIYGDRIGDGIAGSESIMDAVNNGLYQFGEHRCMYDEEKLERLLSAIGFSAVERSAFDPSIDGSWDAREHFSFYVDAFK